MTLKLREEAQRINTLHSKNCSFSVCYIQWLHLKVHVTGNKMDNMSHFTAGKIETKDCKKPFGHILDKW